MTLMRLFILIEGDMLSLSLHLLHCYFLMGRNQNKFPHIFSSHYNLF
jgi:hypothetical protein